MGRNLNDPLGRMARIAELIEEITDPLDAEWIAGKAERKKYNLLHEPQPPAPNYPSIADLESLGKPEERRLL